jgi:serine/threonine-protein kinase
VIGTANLIGARIANYEIQELLGSGGMASVYRAFDLNLHREIAIKVLSESAAAQPGLAARFRQEAQIIAGLRHAHIVKIYDFGEQDGLTYMVQELLPGPTLDQRLRDLAARGEQMGRNEVLAIVAQLAGALDAAHAAGIIHRDVKPANAIANAAGDLTLTDFGIAKNTLGAAQHTQVGMVIGTPHYISPEQARGLSPTPASDIYSLGVVVYELLAGKPPFEGDTMSVVVDHMQTPPPPLRQLRPDLPADVEAVVQQALAKDPAARFNRAGVLASALAQAWPLAPNVAPAPFDIHSQATRLWEGKPADVPLPVTSTTASIRRMPALPAPARAAGAIKATPAAAEALPKRRRSWLPLLGGLLALLLLSGIVMAARRAGGGTAGAPSTPPTIAAAPTAGAAAVATAAPAAATTVPASNSTTAPKPTAAPAPPATPLDQLRALIESGSASGKAGEHGDELLQRVDAAQRALAEGDKRRAADQLGELAKTIFAGATQGAIDPAFARQALEQVAAVAAGNGLTFELPQPPQPSDGGKEKDKGKGKGKGKDKGND